MLRQYSKAEWRSCCFRWWTNQEKWCTHNLPVRGKLLSTKEDNRLLNYSTRKTLGSTFHMLTLCTSHRTLLNLHFYYWLRASFLQVHTLRGEYGVCFIPCSLSSCSPSGSSFGLSEACCVPGHVLSAVSTVPPAGLTVVLCSVSEYYSLCRFKNWQTRRLCWRVDGALCVGIMEGKRRRWGGKWISLHLKMPAPQFEPKPPSPKVSVLPHCTITLFNIGWGTDRKFEKMSSTVYV